MMGGGFFSFFLVCCYAGMSGNSIFFHETVEDFFFLRVAVYW